MTNFLVACEELVAALDPKIVLTKGYGPITSLVLRDRAILIDSNNAMTDFSPAARRPKPPSLKEQALLVIDTAVADDRLSADVADVVRRALEE